MSNSNVNTLVVSNNDNFIQNSVKEFKGFARKTAENILEMGRIVYETREALGNKSQEFESFCSQVGFSSKSKSIVKLAQIGKGYSYLKNQTEYLPNNWTTLYEISKLTEDQLVSYIGNGSIHQFVLGADIKKLNGSTPDQERQEVVEGSDKEVTEKVPNGTIHGLKFLCEVTKVEDVRVQVILQQIFRSLKDIEVKVDIAPELQSALEPFMKEAA